MLMKIHPNGSRCGGWLILLFVLMLSACATAPPAEKVKLTWDGYTSVAISPSGKLVAAANRMVVVLFDIEQRRQVGWFWAIDRKGNGFKLPRSGLGDTLEFIDDHRIVTTGMGGMATVWDVRNGEKVQHIDPLSASMHAISLAYSAATGELVLGTQDGTIYLTSLAENQATEPTLLLSHMGRVTDLVFSEDGKYLASAGIDKTVVIWDMETRKAIGRHETVGDISDLEAVSARRSLIIAGDDVAIWEFLTEEEALELKEEKAIGQWVGTGALYALQIGLFATGLSGGISTHDPQNCGRYIAASPDGRFLVDVKPSPLTNKVTVLDVELNEILHQVDVKNAICDLEFTRDGRHLVLAGDGGVFLVDTSTWTLLPMHLIVDGFMYAPRVVLADPGHMGLDVTGYSGDDSVAPDETDSSDVKINKEE
jgi:WD40 repeat protein